MSYARRMGAFAQFAVLSSAMARRIPADVVFATSTPLTIVAPGWVASAGNRSPLVLEIRDLWPDSPIAVGAVRNRAMIALLRRFERVSYRLPDLLVALSPTMKDSMVATGAVAAEKIAIIPNGCDNDIFLRTHAPTEDNEHLAGRLAGRDVLLYAGSHGVVNGVDYLVKVAKHLRSMGSDLAVVVAGDGARRPASVNLARELGVLDDNIFFIGRQPKSQIAFWYSRAAASISLIIDVEPLWRHAVTNKFFDSLAAGKPVFNNHGGWQVDVATRYNVGAQVSAEPERGAKELVERLSSKPWMEAASRTARILADGPFSRALLASRLETVLMSAVQGNPLPAEMQHFEPQLA